MASVFLPLRLRSGKWKLIDLPAGFPAEVEYLHDCRGKLDVLPNLRRK